MTDCDTFADKRVLVTGVCGTVGSELLRQLCAMSAGAPKEIVGIDNNESALFFLDQEYLQDSRVSLAVVDVRDARSLSKQMRDIDIVFHTAALKHVILSERSPDQAVQTNIIGVQNVVDCAESNQVEKVIFTSSDKAVNPTNVMGTSKLMGERLITAANSGRRSANTIYASTRFGNVLGSSGSVFPIFQNQIAKGGPVTITDSAMTRFVMSIEESVRLVLDTARIALGGEIFVTKMPVVRIVDLAQAMIRLFAPAYGHQADDITITMIGTKPGEKLYEELMSDEETRRSLELEKYFAVLPAFRGVYNRIEYQYPDTLNEVVDDPYDSSRQPALSVMQIISLLQQYGLSDIPQGERPDSAARRYWPGDKEDQAANVSV